MASEQQPSQFETNINEAQGPVIGDHNVVNQYFSGPAPDGGGNESAGSRIRRNIPDLLPYMVDRRAQEDEIRTILQQATPQSPKPLVIMIHGDEYQCHDKFVDRLVTYTLPMVQSPSDRASIVTPYFLRWPTHVRDADALKGAFLSELGLQTLGDSSATTSNIQASLASNPGTVMIWTQVLTDDWRRLGLQGLQSFIQNWQDWPDLVPRQRLIVCWLMKYQMKKSGIIESRRNQSANKKIEISLDAFPKHDYPRLDCLVLSKLEGIERPDVENWALSQDTLTFYKGPDPLPKIREIFQEWQSERKSSMIPMEDLSNLLIKDILSGPSTY